MNYLKAAVLAYIASDIAITKGVIEENAAEANSSDDYEMLAVDYKNLARLNLVYEMIRDHGLASIIRHNFYSKQEFEDLLEQVWNHNMHKET